MYYILLCSVGVVILLRGSNVFFLQSEPSCQPVLSLQQEFLQFLDPSDPPRTVFIPLVPVAPQASRTSAPV